MKDLPVIDLAQFNPGYGVSEYRWGPPVPNNGNYWQEHQYHAEILAWYYHDYLGTHIYMQVWDYAQQDDPEQRWQMVLVLHRPTRHVNADDCIVGGSWDWVMRREYEEPWSEGGPTYTQVGHDVDKWVKSPQILRFLLEG